MSQPKASAVEAILRSLEREATIPISQVQVGPFWTAVVSRHCGLASTPHAAHTPCEPGAAESDMTPLIGQPALEVAQWIRSAVPLRAAIGMAAINSLTELDEARCTQRNARDILLERGAGRRVAMVGHFPFVDQLRSEVDELWVLELNPRPGDLPAHEAPTYIPRADVVGITGVTLINHTFDALIRLCRPDAYVVMLGGSAPLSPVLFDFGLDAIGGTVVDEAELVMQDIASGATFRQLRGKRPVLMFKE